MEINDRNAPKIEPLTILDFGVAFNKTLPPIKILVADDDPPSRMLLNTSLKQWGYEVIEASDGEEAWQIMQQPNPPRLLILDWLMPKIDGINLCSKIRQDLADSGSYYIILLSQITGNSNIKIAIEGGANEFLSKPFDYQELRSRVYSAARLIQYEIKLSDENKRLMNNAGLIQDISIQVLTMQKKMDDILGSGTNLDKEQQQKVLELKETIDKAVGLIRRLQT